MPGGAQEIVHMEHGSEVCLMPRIIAFIDNNAYPLEAYSTPRMLRFTHSAVFNACIQESRI